MGRPELAQALASIARQNYPKIEVIVVDATGGSHPPLPDIAWRPGHVLRVVGGGRRLPRPLACNVGLDDVTGEWFGFLDDDDTYEPHHVSAMVEAVQRHPHALVVYGQSRMLGPDGRVEKLFGFPFNRALLYHMPLFYWQAALISQKVRALGCRFDEALEVCEDRDFLQQIAEHGDFAFVPVIGFNYRPDLGTSGTGTGANRDLARLLYYDGLLKAKWAGPSEYHTARAARGVRRAIEAYGRGDLETSRGLLEATLADYPDDPNAMHAMARLDFEAGRLEKAQDEVAGAIELNPRAFEYCLTQALILERLGDEHGARAAAQRAVADPVFRAAALALLGRLAKGEPLPAAASSAKPVARNQPCPCGSGKRYKHCCGANAPVSAGIANSFQATADDQAVARATERFREGEAFASKVILDPIYPERLSSPHSALEAAHIYRELGELQREFDFLARASRLDGQSQIGLRLEQCVEQLFADVSWDSLRRQALLLLAGINARGKAAAAWARESEKPRIHLANDFRAIGGSENHTIRLYQVLSPFAEVILWSQSEPIGHYRALCPDMRVLDPSRGAVPEGGTLVIVGNYLDMSPWIDAIARCSRIVLSINVPDLPHMKRVLAALTMMDALQADFSVDFTYPSRMWRNHVGLGGATEYPPTDTQRFTRQRPHGRETSRLIVGRLARGDRMKFHPDDPGLMRRIIGRGHVCRIMDGTPLTDALQSEARPGQVEMLPLNAMDARDFLEGLDCFLYWKHPLWIETGCNAVLEAMAMELPVIMFARDLGVAELIEHGKDGFLVETEEEALECLDRLAASAELRKSVGQAARRKVMAILDRQQARMLDFYLGTDVSASPDDQPRFPQQ